jgi:cell division protein FtsQ
VLVLLSLALAGTVFWIRLDAPVQRILVQGKLDAAEKAQITDVVAAHLDGGLLGADLDELTARLVELSWPRQVSIRRVWPDQLVIRVAKAMVVAAWDDAYLTSDGQVVRLAEKRPDLVRFDCAITGPLPAMELFQRLDTAGAGTGLEITMLRENSRGEWTVVYGGNPPGYLPVNLGAVDLHSRLARFVTVYRQSLADRVDNIAQIDARYANGVAVSWRAGLDSNSAVASADGERMGQR